MENAEQAYQITAQKVTAQELQQFTEELECLDAERAEIGSRRKILKAEIKRRGYKIRPIKIIVDQMKRGRDELHEDQEIVDLYSKLLGCDLW